MMLGAPSSPGRTILGQAQQEGGPLISSISVQGAWQTSPIQHGRRRLSARDPPGSGCGQNLDRGPPAPSAGLGSCPAAPADTAITQSCCHCVS